LELKQVAKMQASLLLQKLKQVAKMQASLGGDYDPP
jgi:hypothetical protein